MFTDRKCFIMIKYFAVENYKGFKNKIELDLSRIHDYQFHQDAIKNGLTNKMLLFGKNGSGKSNLGKAIMDVTRHLTSNFTKIDMGVFKNLSRTNDCVSFDYVFKFGDDEVEYKYSKDNPNFLLNEELSFNGEKVIFCDYVERKTFLKLEGAEQLDKSKYDFTISLVLYVYSRSGFRKGGLFDRFYDFINRMLSFRSLKENEFEGFLSQGRSFADILIDHGKEDSLKGLENFLAKEGIVYKLDIIKDVRTNANVIGVKYQKGWVPLHSIWSTGTSSLVLFYCWLLDLKKTSFLFLDEFDAFYHYELSEDVLKRVTEDPSYQCIVTTHNCSLMSNKLTRPDCCFIIRDNEIVKNLTDCTEREIREGHNLENLYKNGAFCE